MSSSPARKPRKLATSRTNRVEGKGFYWKQDNGAETLEFYPSAAYSNFVELSRLGGELGFCAPSDYIKINEDLYIYTRTECEFSGTFTAYVMDLNRIEQIGRAAGLRRERPAGILRLPRQGRVAGAARPVRKIRRRKRLAGSSRCRRTSSGERRAARLPAAADHGENDAGGSRCCLRKTYVSLCTARHPARCRMRPSRPWPAIADRAPTGWPASRLRCATTTAPAMEYRFDDADNLNWRKEGTATGPRRAIRPSNLRQE